MKTRLTTITATFFLAVIVIACNKPAEPKAWDELSARDSNKYYVPPIANLERCECDCKALTKGSYSFVILKKADDYVLIAQDIEENEIIKQFSLKGKKREEFSRDFGNCWEKIEKQISKENLALLFPR